MEAAALTQTREHVAQNQETSGLSEITEIAASVWAEALDACLAKLDLRDREMAMARLQAGESTACAYLHHELACRIAERMAAIDGKIKAAYLLDEFDTAEEAWIEGAKRVSTIQMILWVQPRTAALSSLVDALDAALLPQYTALMGVPNMTRLLLAHFIDDASVRDRVGFGLLLTSIHHRPIRVWER